jgi:hypothetical protein
MRCAWHYCACVCASREMQCAVFATTLNAISSSKNIDDAISMRLSKQKWLKNLMDTARKPSTIFQITPFLPARSSSNAVAHTVLREFTTAAGADHPYGVR